MIVKTICAHCNTHLGYKEVADIEGEPLNHGICKKCYNGMMKEIRARKNKGDQYMAIRRNITRVRVTDKEVKSFKDYLVQIVDEVIEEQKEGDSDA